MLLFVFSDTKREHIITFILILIEIKIYLFIFKIKLKIDISKINPGLKSDLLL